MAIHLSCLATRFAFLAALFFAALVVRPSAHGQTHGQAHDTMPAFASEEELDLYCLKASYPEIRDARLAGDGSVFLIIDGAQGFRQVVYAGAERPDSMPEYRVTDVRTSMKLPYPLEPLRPDLPDAFSPGRWRSYDLITALYGESRANVQENIVVVSFQGQTYAVHRSVAAALSGVDRELSQAVAEDKSMGRFLIKGSGGGGYTWRTVAGESYMSPHAYGMAIDLNPQAATYWRWSRLRPHPLQRSYPARIVEAFEKHGFIWGGKWHEYDMMHFEYRPELICKARHRQYWQDGAVLGRYQPAGRNTEYSLEIQ